MGFFDDVGSSVLAIGTALVTLVVIAVLVATTADIGVTLAPAGDTLVNNTTGDTAVILSNVTDVVRLVFVIALLFLVIFVIKRQTGGGA